jgi:transposase
MRFVPALSAEEAAELRRLYREANTHRLRQRAHAILLSARGWRVDALADLFESDRDTVSRWLDHWEARRPGALLEAALGDAPKSGRPRKLSAEDQAELCAHAAAGRPNLKAAALAACSKKG